MRHLAGVIGFVAVSGQASAQDLPLPSVTANPDVLWSCLAAGDSAIACAGAMTAVCIAENTLASPNLTERLCVIEESNTWRDLISDAEVVLERRLAHQTADPVIGAPLDAFRASHDAWARYVRDQCRFERAAAADRPDRAIRENTCQRNLSALRYQQLLDVLEPVQ